MTFTVPSVLAFWTSWFAMSIAMAQLSGWRGLAGRFGVTSSSSGRRYWLASGAVSQWPWLPIQYIMTFVLTVSDEGLRMSVFFPMRLLHAPFTIPWSAISAVTHGPFLKVFQQTEVVVADRRILIRGRAGKAVFRAWQGYLSRVGAAALAQPSA